MGSKCCNRGTGNDRTATPIQGNLESSSVPIAAMIDHAYPLTWTRKIELTPVFIYLSDFLSSPEIRPVGLDPMSLQLVKTSDRSLAPIPISSKTKQHSAIIRTNLSHWWSSCKTEEW